MTGCSIFLYTSVIWLDYRVLLELHALTQPLALMRSCGSGRVAKECKWRTKHVIKNWTLLHSDVGTKILYPDYCSVIVLLSLMYTCKKWLGVWPCLAYLQRHRPSPLASSQAPGEAVLCTDATDLEEGNNTQYWWHWQHIPCNVSGTQLAHINCHVLKITYS